LTVAVKDIDNIISYIASENYHAADDFLETLYASMNKLSENPFMGHKRDDLTD